MKSLLVVVLYKESISSSQTLSSLSHNCSEYINDLFLVIWDNSPCKVNEEELKLLEKIYIRFAYHHTPENLALSKIYNSVIQLYGKKNEALFLFDQDSYITADYFILMKESMQKNVDIDLFVPYIQVDDQIVSPGKMGFYTGEYLKEKIVGRICSKNMIAITSGMVIRISLFYTQNIKFDENLSLYGIDTKFCIDYSERNDYLYVLDYQLEHSLSMFEPESNSVKMRRLKENHKSLSYILLKKKNTLGYMIHNIQYIVKLSWLKLQNIC